ncbi:MULTISPECIES: signal peptidase [Chryseobacterium]|uniref:Signal peptidase n=2 Tax=Chryseobacterium TaxID=59732 RepID=A0A3D9AFY0_9FLAO|nr:MULTISPECIES: signal peptidase [Chryseobacterium]OVE54408.1 signal peptidase [Chryseobacterium mucoviscidosis]REC40299.1 signal peptidase [Candidatus Chryseobacterium massiliae]HAO07147.1 signal peptidase [Chryseobacterium sp.]HCR77896.1 signal peptidase [Chryseobacterium sp.]
MKTINKLVSTFFLFAILWVSAQAPPNPGDGGTGGSGSGGTVVSSPIDMYVYALGIIAVLFIAFFTKRYTAKKA